MKNKSEHVALREQNIRAACPKDKLEFKSFSSPALVCIFHGL